jgi:RNA polymerase sigma factor (sigma-70 family)
VKQYDKVLQLLDTSGLQLRNLLFRMTLCENTSDDLMQELFLRLAASRKFARSPNAFAYAWRTAVNLAIDSRRKEYRLRPVAERAAEEGAKNGLLAKLIADENLRMIMDEIAALRPPARDVLLMRYLEQRPYSEIAGLMDKKENHIRSLCSKALNTLRHKLDGQLDAER